MPYADPALHRDAIRKRQREWRERERRAAGVMPRASKWLGVTFNRLTIMSQNGKKCMCRCECGSITERATSSVVCGLAKSCGCLKREVSAARTTTHGGSELPEYNNWQLMKDRCLNPRNENFSRYGGRGITVCDRWLNSFENFYADMGPRPGQKFTLDRYPNNDGNYEPGNVRWATRKEQANNTSHNVLVSIGGETKTVTQWAEANGIRPLTAISRIHYGIAPVIAVTHPLQPGKKIHR